MTGHQLMDIRRDWGFSRTQLARRLGVTWLTVWHWEKDQRRVPDSVASLVVSLSEEGKRTVRDPLQVRSAE
jgi:DNA-binding transcriptional regulator YiaG